MVTPWPALYGSPVFLSLSACLSFFHLCLAENPSNIHYIEQLSGLDESFSGTSLHLSTSFSTGTVFSGSFLDSLLATVSVAKCSLQRGGRMVQALGNKENASQFRVLFDSLKKLVHIHYFIFFHNYLAREAKFSQFQD